MPCVVTMNLTPQFSSSRMFARTSSADRPNRSSFHTSTASASPRRAASIIRRRPGRSFRAPLPISSTSTATRRPRRAATARSSRRARVGSWSRVETRWYRAARPLSGVVPRMRRQAPPGQIFLAPHSVEGTGAFEERPPKRRPASATTSTASVARTLIRKNSVAPILTPRCRAAESTRCVARVPSTLRPGPTSVPPAPPAPRRRARAGARSWR